MARKKKKSKIPKGDALSGKSIFKRECAVCHSTTGKDSKGEAAPDLKGVFKRKVGKGTNFPYSNAFKKSKLK